MAKRTLGKLLKQPPVRLRYTSEGYTGEAPGAISALCRASVLAYIRSATYAGKYVGLYVSAKRGTTGSDGTISLQYVDFNGNFLDESWEQPSEELVNCDDQDFYVVINKIFRQQSNCRSMQDSILGNVVIGRDVGDAPERASEAVVEALKEFRCTVRDYGTVSRPELHFLIKRSNDKRQLVDKEEYISFLTEHFSVLCRETGSNLPMGVDTGNGIAREKITCLMAKVPEIGFEILNGESDEEQNAAECGAPYILSTKELPKLKKSSRCRLSASFNSDMTRMVLYDDTRHYDGAPQAVFFACFLKNLIERAGIRCNIGAVLGLQSNTGAVEYLQAQSRLKVIVVSSDQVSEALREARTFDVGLYFEADGCGSIFFSRTFLSAVDSLSFKEESPLRTIVRLYDTACPDALLNTLVCKACLKGPEELIPYREYFSRHLRLIVRDKAALLRPADIGRVDLSIQKEIEQVAAVFKGRAFLHVDGPDGTVEVQAEGVQEMQCDRLALTVAQMVYDRCRGVGVHPEISYIDWS